MHEQSQRHVSGNRTRGGWVMKRRRPDGKAIRSVAGLLSVLIFVTMVASGQSPAPNSEAPKKANSRPAESTQPKAEPFDGASIERMTGQCVTLETEQGTMVIEM